MNWPVVDEFKNDGQIVIQGNAMVNATSNDYLGMAQNDELKQHIAEAIHTYGCGATGSRRLSGNHQLFLDTEETIAHWIGKKAAILFNSGYQMNASIFSALSQKSTLIVADKLIHASIIDGIQNSDAQLMRFRHNDMVHLLQLLKKYAHQYSDVMIVCESIYSMDGDALPLKSLVEIKQAYNATLIVDEAHSMGCFGPRGNGWVNEHECLNEVDIIMVTFGKAFGLSGAMVVANQDIVARLRAKCRGYIYSTALALPIAAGIQKACDIIQNADNLRLKLKKNIQTFTSIIQTESDTQIQPIIVGEKQKAIQLEQELIKAGYFVRAVHHPTVPMGQSRLRITITSTQSTDQLMELAQQINQYRFEISL